MVKLFRIFFFSISFSISLGYSYSYCQSTTVNFNFTGAIESWTSKIYSRSDEFFWIDNFITNQHQTEKSFDWWTTLFKQCVLDIGRAVMVMSPWNAPVFTTRAWCLYEISCSRQNRLFITLDSSQRLSFQQAILTNFKSIFETLFQSD
jgi:hypothetical protein